MTRVERDALGKVEVPDEVYYGIQTKRATENFDVSYNTTSQYREYIHAISVIKGAAAKSNLEIGALDREIAQAIIEASREMQLGHYDHFFTIDVLQGGGGTSTNMNANEILANRANEMLTGHKGYMVVHPNDHVNMGQSTNDVIPSAIKMAIYRSLDLLIKNLMSLRTTLNLKSIEYKDVVKLGRTCLQDALPLTVGQEFGGYHSMIKRHLRHLQSMQDEFLEIPLGATAVGTGLGTYQGYTEAVFDAIKEMTGLPFKQEPNLFDGLQNADCYVYLSGALKALAVGLSKMASDFRFLSSGPRAGLGELILPAVQPGSSIMPGKVNPVIPELVNQIAYQVCGNDVAITMACEGGELDLNVWEPVFIKNIFESIRLLTRGIVLFDEKCIQGIKVNREVCESYAHSSLALSTVISSLFDYKTGSEVAKYAHEANISIAEAAIKEGVLREEEVKELLNPLVLSDAKRSSDALVNYIK